MLPRFGLVQRACTGAALLAAAAVAFPVRADEVVTHWIMPVIDLPEAERPADPNVFGTIALPVRARSTSTRWSKVMHASLDQPGLDRLTAEARALSPDEGVAYVQSAVSRAVRTSIGPNNCSDDGYWAPAQETLARGIGDCFDVAIAKMEALRLLGFRDRDMYLTTGWFRNDETAPTGKGRESVALLVRVDEHFWLLSERSGQAVASDSTWSAPEQFTPVVTYGVGMTWVHGKVVHVAAMGLGSVAGAATTSAAGSAR